MDKKILCYIMLSIFSIGVIVFVYNDYFLYKTPILKVTNVKDVRVSNSEIINQNIIGIVKNGKYKGKIYSLDNETSISGVYDDYIKINTELLVNISKSNSDSVQIIDIKRDKYICIFLVLFIDSVIIIGKKKGITSLIILMCNTALFVGSIYFYMSQKLFKSILVLFMILSIIFIVISLLLYNGNSKKTLAAIASSVVSLFISFTISYVILHYYNSSINYWTMDYIELLSEYEEVFYINILLSGLGAIMDIATTMSSSLNELIETNSNITLKSLKKSGREISKDILSTMTNVMLFTCYISAIPMIIIAIKGYMPFITAIKSYGQIEMIRILTSCISIVLAIPISLYISIWILRRRKKYD